VSNVATVKELAAFIGKEATYHPERAAGLSFRVVILDVSMAYGKTRFVITPVAGSGSKQVDQDSLTGLPGQTK
jgi:hypothetical protein